MLRIGILLFFCSTAWASQVYVEPATGSGVTQDDLVTTTQLIRSAVPEVSSNRVVEFAGRADYSLRPNLLRLGSAYVLELSKVDKDGSPEYSGRLKAERMDELDKVATRLTRSVLAGIRPSNDRHVGEIADRESLDGTQRRPARNAWYLGIGGAEFNNLNVNGLGYSLGGAYNWDLNTALVKVLAEFSGLDSAFIASLGIGGDYLLTTGDVAPYLSADFGFGAAKAEGGEGFFSGQTNGGFDLGLGAGVQLLRTAAVNLDLKFRAGFLLHSNSYGTPEVFSFRLGLYF